MTPEVHTALTMVGAFLVLAGAAALAIKLYDRYATPPEPKPEPDPLDRPSDGPTVTLFCLGCSQTVVFGVHMHTTPFGSILHVNQDDIELHELTCTPTE